MDDNGKLIELSGISKAIPHSESMALVDATCVINHGEYVSIIGASGSGKTTLLSVIGLLDHPSGGTYRCGNVDVATLDEAGRNRLRGRSIGFVFQNSFLIAEESSARNVGLGLRVHGVPRADQAQLIEAALAQVGLADAADKRAGDLSGGEKQRVAVARALVTRPTVILADEPTGSLDSDSTNNLITLLRQINREGTTVVVVTHDPLVAESTDRSILLEDGVIHADLPSLPVEDAMRGVPRVSFPAFASDQSTLPWAKIGHEIGDALIAPLLRPVRSILVLLAYILGVTALVAAMGVMSSTTQQIVYRLTEAGSNVINVTDSVPADGSWEYLDQQARYVVTLEGVRDAVPIQTYAGVSNVITRIRGLGDRYSGTIMVTDQRYMAAHSMSTAHGDPDLLSNSWKGRAVVVGAVAAQSLGLATVEPGVTVWVNDHPIDVVAILNPSDSIHDNTLFFSPDAAVSLADPLSRFIEVHSEPGYAEPLAEAIPTLLSPGNPGQIHTSTVAQLAQLQQGISTDLSTLLTVIGWVILLLSALTAGTTMFLSVQHRAAEIALRRAMGASRGSIFRLFTLEGVGIGLTGGIVGTGLGIALTVVVSRINGWPLSVGVYLVIMGWAVGLLAGAVASIVPAVYASRRDPAQILRTV